MQQARAACLVWGKSRPRSFNSFHATASLVATLWSYQAYLAAICHPRRNFLDGYFLLSLQPVLKNLVIVFH